MIYIDQNTSKLAIPRTTVDQPTSICIKNIISDVSETIQIDELEMNKYLYNISISNWPIQFEDGSQYEYYLYNANTLLTSGIIQCGDFTNNNNVQYDINEKNYKQYNG